MRLILALLGCAPPADEPEDATVRWRPGDAIPGWEDYACDPEDRGYVLDSFFPYRSLRVTFAPGTQRYAPARVEGVFADCDRSNCDAWDQGGMWMEFAVTAGADDAGQLRGQGWYAMVPGAADGRRASGFASVLVGRLWDLDHGVGYNADVSVCLSRVRPDEVSGYVRWDMWGVPLVRGQHWPDWRSAVWRQKFTVRFPDAPSATEPPSPPTFTDPPAPPWFDYGGVGYDAAWPWDEIVDPTLRDHIRERYRPR